MPKRQRLDASLFDIDTIQDKFDQRDECADALKKASMCTELPETKLKANENLAWAFLQCSVPNVIRTVQVLKDIGHLGTAITTRCLSVIARGDNEEKAMIRIAEQLLPCADQFSPMCETVVLATPNDRCVCGESFVPSEVRFSKSRMFTLLDVWDNVHTMRIYCRKCNRMNYPFCADKRGCMEEHIDIGLQHNENEEGKIEEEDEDKVEDEDVVEAEEDDGDEGKDKDEDEVQERTYYEYNAVQFVMGNRANYFSTALCELYASTMSHAWVSAIGFTESFNEAKHNLRHTTNCGTKNGAELFLDRKVLARAFIEHETWKQLIEDRAENGKDTDKLLRDLSAEDYLRSSQFNDRGLYDHKHTKECDEKGCKFIGIGDGNWKIQYPLCMFQLLQTCLNGTVAATNCKEEPFRRRAFCKKHCDIMNQKGYPTDVRQFMERCKTKLEQEKAHRAMMDVFTDEREQLTNSFSTTSNESTNNVNGGHISDAEELLSDDEIDQQSIENKPTTRSMAKRALLKDVQQTLAELGEETVDQTVQGRLMQTISTEDTKPEGIAKCFKNVGGKKRLNHWLRGHFFIVAPCGQIHRWEPLYGSESPSQAFLIMMDHLMIALKEFDQMDWHKYTMVYDNMCHVDDMKIARKPLPTHSPDGNILFPHPYNMAFTKINKVIDNLHLSNHVDPRCKVKYNAESIASLHPDISVNTMRAEETFVWLSRFKKILCAQPKSHHHFYLHRLITRRNRYTTWKISIGGSVMLPKARPIHAK